MEDYFVGKNCNGNMVLDQYFTTLVGCEFKLSRQHQHFLKQIEYIGERENNTNSKGKFCFLQLLFHIYVLVFACIICHHIKFSFGEHNQKV